MSNFGKYAILQPVKHVFEKEPEWFWLIRPPTAQDELIVAQLLSTERVAVDASGMRVSILPTTLEIAMREVALTFGGTNIPTSETNPAPALPENAAWSRVEEFLKIMPREMVLEIWRAVGDAVPGWGPVKYQQAAKTGDAKNE